MQTPLYLTNMGEFSAHLSNFAANRYLSNQLDFYIWIYFIMIRILTFNIRTLARFLENILHSKSKKKQLSGTAIHTQVWKSVKEVVIFIY